MRENYSGLVMCKAVMPSSPQRFRTTAKRGENTKLSTRRHCLYSHAEKLQTVDKESPSGPKHNCNQCSKLHK